MTAEPTGAPTPTLGPPTGLGWTAVQLPDAAPGDDVTDVVHADTFWLAVGHGGGNSWAWMSTDTSFWHRVDIDAWDGALVTQVANWEGRLIAAGSVGSGIDTQAAFWSSNDGTSWDRLPDSPAYAFYQGERIQAYWPAAGVLGGEILTLHADPMSDTPSLRAVGQLHCNCATEWPPPVSVWSSARGTNWSWDVEDRQLPVEPAWTGERWVRVDEGQQQLEASDSGEDWEVVWAPDSNLAVELWAVVANGGELLAVGRGNTGPLTQTAVALESQDGLTWTQSTGWPDLLLGYMTGVTIEGAVVVAYGRGGTEPSDADELPVLWLSRLPI